METQRDGVPVQIGEETTQAYAVHVMRCHGCKAVLATVDVFFAGHDCTSPLPKS